MLEIRINGMNAIWAFPLVRKPNLPSLGKWELPNLKLKSSYGIHTRGTPISVHTVDLVGTECI